MARNRKRLLTFNDPTPLRIDRRLAMEIGFLESVVLLQLEYLISISNHEREGQFWTYQTLQDLKDRHFPWLSLPTISRVLKSLEELGLITVGNHNRSTFDRTRWFALRYEGIRNLESVRIGEDAPIFQNEKCISQTENSILQNEKSIFQNDKSILQDDKSILQDETTIPEITTETTAKSTTTVRPPADPSGLRTGRGARAVVVVASEDVDEKSGLAVASTAPPLRLVETSAAGGAGEGRGASLDPSAAFSALVEALCGKGVTRRNAEKLAGSHSEEAIRRQLAMLDYRRAEDPAAVLVTAIEQEWAPPQAWVKREKQRLRSEVAARERKARAVVAQTAADEEARRSALLETVWEGLPEAERREIDERMRRLFRERHLPLVRAMEKNPDGPIVRAMLRAIRDELLEDRIHPSPENSPPK